MPNHNLTKTEVEMLTRLLGIAQIYEDTLRAITQSYKMFILDEVFPRLKIERDQFKNTVVNIQTGELVIQEPKKDEVQK